MPDYEIRLIKSDGRTDLVYVANYQSDAAAKAQAEILKSKLRERVEIWCEDRKVNEENAGPDA
jgi:hypothetical protein